MRLEQYVVLWVPTHFRRDRNSRFDIDLAEPHVLTLLAFVAWPYRDFESKFRYRFTYFWVPVYGS